MRYDITISAIVEVASVEDLANLQAGIRNYAETAIYGKGFITGQGCYPTHSPQPAIGGAVAEELPLTAEAADEDVPPQT